MVTIDCETTGLDPRRDPSVSFAALRIGEGAWMTGRPSTR
jgi:hypothetical protein